MVVPTKFVSYKSIQMKLQYRLGLKKHYSSAINVYESWNGNSPQRDAMFSQI